MNISPWTDTPFDEPDAFADFALSHGLAHDKIAAVMYGNGNTYVTYPLYDTVTYERDWLLDHQAEHESIYSLLGLSGLPDLATVDMKKPDEYSDWLLQHQQVHVVLNSVLGITS